MVFSLYTDGFFSVFFFLVLHLHSMKMQLCVVAQSVNVHAISAFRSKKIIINKIREKLENIKLTGKNWVNNSDAHAIAVYRAKQLIEAKGIMLK